jgi:hypothetical protein
LFPYLFIFTIKSVAISAQSIKKDKGPRAVTTLETKFKIIADRKAGKRAVDIPRTLGTPSKTVRTVVDKQKYNSFSRRRMIHSPQLLHF